MTRYIVIDDDPDILSLVKANIRAWGDECVGVTSLEDARAALVAQPADVLLLDLAMPEMDGVTVLKALRADGLAPERVCLLSAIPPEELEHIAAELDTIWISKPFTADGLREGLDQSGDAK